MSVQVGFSAGAKMAGGLKKTGQARRMIKTVKGPANEIKVSWLVRTCLVTFPWFPCILIALSISLLG